MILYAGRLMYHKESPRRQCCTAFVAFHADSLQSLVELLAAGKSFSVTAVQTEPRLTKRQAVKSDARARSIPLMDILHCDKHYPVVNCVCLHVMCYGE